MTAEKNAVANLLSAVPSLYAAQNHAVQNHAVQSPVVTHVKNPNHVVILAKNPNHVVILAQSPKYVVILVRSHVVIHANVVSKPYA